MTSIEPLEPPPPKTWPSIHCPPRTKIRTILRDLLSRDGLTVLSDIYEPGSYWAIVKPHTPDAPAYALLCLSSLAPDRTLHYLRVPEALGFPSIPPRSFYAHLLSHCPTAPSPVAQSRRDRCVKHYAALDALPDYPVGTEFSLAGVRMRITTPITSSGFSASNIADGGLLLLKRDHLIFATIHLPDQASPPEDDAGNP